MARLRAEMNSAHVRIMIEVGLVRRKWTGMQNGPITGTKGVRAVA